MLHQQEILTWLKMFNVSQIKHFLTIKIPSNLEYIQRITSYLDFKPKDRMTHGYSEGAIVNESRAIYKRDQYRYKNKKEEKMAIDEIFLENITASRINPFALSVKKEYIRNGKLSECMLVLSDHQIFNSITAKYHHSQLGSYQDSAWFKITTINSFSMWIVRAFQLEIFHAYYTHESVHSINRFVFAEECLTRERARKMLEGVVGGCLERLTRNMKKGESMKGEDVMEIASKEEGAFLLQRCLEKLEEKGRDLGEIVFQEIWAVAAECDQKVYKIFRRIEEMLMAEYGKYEIDVACKEIQNLKNNSKRKKKAKKSKEVQQHSTEHQSKVEQQFKEEKVQDRIKEEESPLKVTIINPPQTKPEIQKQKRNVKLAETQKKATLNTFAKKNKQNSQNKTATALQQKDFVKTNQQREKQQQKKAKKIVQERINEYILNFYEQIYESSQNFDKYRKICFEILQLTIEQLKIPEKWSLQLFGSASINFALKQSDLDLVLILESEKSCTLNDIYELFKVKEWLRECNLILATKVPIVEFQVLLSQLKHPKIKENKKLINTVIHVDISISYRRDPHEGIKNSIFLKEIFENHPNLMTICLILKELLRVNGLNKPYKGGIGSYVLVILAHNILKVKNIDFCESFLDQMKAISKYLSTQFQPFATLITPFKNSKIIPNSELSLNLQDPHERVLLHTSARLINEIIVLFKQLHLTLQNIEHEMAAINIQQRKKMKRIFFENWNILFKSEPLDL